LARYLLPGDLAGPAEEGQSESWFAKHSVCKHDDPLDEIVKLGCTWRWLDEN